MVVDIKSFIVAGNEKHNDKYSYTKFEYLGHNVKSIIICPIHGDFLQSSTRHLNSGGCKKCAKENTTENSWKYKDWKASGLASKYFDGFKVYVLRCWNKNEEFYKIGKTYQKVTRRFGSGADKTRMPYNYEIVSVSEYDSLFTCNMEKLLQNINKQYKYTPKTKFPGHTECFSSIELLDCD